MRFRGKYTHVIDAIFPIAVFFVFACSALIVLLLAAHIYRDTTADTDKNYTTRTAWAYVSEKIRQGDEGGSVGVAQIDGTSCLAIKSYAQETEIAYTTYIYAQDEELKELRIRDGLDVDLEAGTEIVPMQSFTVEELDGSLFKLIFTAEDGSSLTICTAERSAA